MNVRSLIIGFVAAVALLGVGAGVTLIAVGGGDDDGDSSSQAVASPTAGAGPDVAPTATPVPPSPTPVPPMPEPPPPPPPSEPPVRTDCNAIRATGYASDSERNYFLANCTGSGQAASGPAAPTPRPSGPPAPPAPTGPTAEELAYRSKANAQITYVVVRLSQFSASPTQGFQSDILDLGAIMQQVANQLDSMAPAPPRFVAVHNELRASSSVFANFCRTTMVPRSLAEFQTWVNQYNAQVTRFNNAVTDYNLVVGVTLPRVGR